MDSEVMDPEDLFIHVHEWSRLIRQAIDGDRASIDMVNHYIVVTILFAVVQGLMIPQVLDRSSSTSQGAAAAVFAFLGFSLDVGGTFPGALYLGILHARRHTYTTVFNDLAQFMDDFKIVVRSSRPRGIMNANEEDSGDHVRPGQRQAAQATQTMLNMFSGGPGAKFDIKGGHFIMQIPRVQDTDVKQRLQRGFRFLNNLKTYPFVRPEDLRIIDYISQLFRELSNASREVSGGSAQDEGVLRQVETAESNPHTGPSSSTLHRGSSQGGEAPASLQSAEISRPSESPSPPEVAALFFTLFFCSTFLGGFFLGLSMVFLLLSFERNFENFLGVICFFVFFGVVFLPTTWQKFAFPQFLPSQSRLNVLESNSL